VKRGTGLYALLPLTFLDGKPAIEWHTEWDLAAFEAR
jgi:hypothetical protein